MRLKLDEDLSEQLRDHLASLGYDAATVVGQRWTGTEDTALWPRLIAEKIFWITADKGFGDVRIYRPGTHAGILLLRPDKESISAYRALIDRVLQRHRLEDLQGALTVVSARSIRVRRK
jgi:predicted nuclease of predicted toxin-antitoxin system